MTRVARADVVLELQVGTLESHQGDGGGTLGLVQVGAGLGDEWRCLFGSTALVGELSA